MDGAGRNGRKLRRIIALLLSLASVADLAAGRAFPIRWMVLAILRRGERAAQVYVADVTQMARADLELEMEACTDPGDAALLGWRFRWLAALLGALLEQLGGGDGTADRLDRAAPALAPRARRHLAMAGFGQPVPYDTS